MKKESTDGLLEIVLGSFHGLMCKYSIEGFLYYYQDVANGTAGLEACSDAAVCLFLTAIAGGLSGVLYYDGIKRIYKSTKTKNSSKFY